MATGISSRRIDETPVAVIDFETTGLTPGLDRVVEVSVVRIDPGGTPTLVFDTLVNPARPMAATEIHGITDADVAHAPRFQEIAGEVLAAVEGCVIAAYNVYFDIKFLDFELSNAGAAHAPPHFCLMYLRPMLGLGSRCKLAEACEHHGIDYGDAHFAAHDALASGQLFCKFRDDARRRNISTFDDLAALKSYKFCSSFARDPFPGPSRFGLARGAKSVSRARVPVSVDPERKAITAYWDALKGVLADLEITEEELADMLAERQRGGLKPEQIRVLHAKAFANAISQLASDQSLDDRDVRKLRRLHECLGTLGWAPGQ